MKSIFWTGLLAMAIFCAEHSFAGESFFANGTRLFVGNADGPDGGSIFLQSRDGKQKPICPGPIYSLEEVGRVHNSHLITFQAKDGFWVASQFGHKTPFLADYSRIKFKSEPFGSWEHRLRRFRDNDREYLVVTFPFENPTSEEQTGQTFLINAHGKSLLVNTLWLGDELDQATVENGELKLPRGPAIGLKKMRFKDGAKAVEGEEGSPAEPTRPLEPARREYGNGAILVVETSPPAVYLETAGVREAIPGVEFRRHVLPAKEAAPEVDLFTTADEAYAVTAGKIIALPLAAKYFAADKGSRTVTQVGVQHGGVNFVLVSFSYRERKGESLNTGETFLIAENGLWFRVDYTYHKTIVPEIDDDILSIPGGYRKLDLRNLRAEARFPALPRRELTSDQGKGNVKAAQTIERVFPDLGDEILQNASRIFPGPDDDPTLEDLQIALLTEDAGSAVLTGESGSGKTEKIKTFILKVRQGLLPAFPRTTRFPNFTSLGIDQGAIYIGMTGSRVNLAVQACREAPTFLVMEDLHAYRGKGAHSVNPNDIFQDLLPALSEGSVRILANDTPDQFRRHFAGDESILRRLIEVKNREVKTVEEVLPMLEQWLSTRKKPALDRQDLAYLVTTANRFSAIGAQPAKSTALLRYVYAMLEQKGEYDRSATRIDIQRAAQKLYGIDAAFFDRALMEQRVRNVPAGLDLYVVGHTRIKAVLSDLARQFFAGVHDPNKPPVRVLVTGDVGTGKTETAIAFARVMGLPYAVIDMASYAEGGSKKFLNQVARALRANAFTVLIFDELEKAHIEIQQLLLGMMNGGSFSVEESMDTSAEGRKTVPVSALNASFFATANAAHDYVARSGKPNYFEVAPAGDRDHDSSRPVTFGQEVKIYAQDQRLRDKAIGGGLSRPVADRFQYVLASENATEDEFKAILALHLKKALGEFAANGLQVKIQNEGDFIQTIGHGFFSEKISNRRVLDLLQNYLRSYLADWILESGVDPHRADAEPVLLKFDVERPKRFEVACPDLLSA